jgi:ATP phosphoribosyltransferase
VRETIPDCEMRVSFLKRCGFGHADVVVAVPICWIDVTSMADLEEASQLYRRVHGRPIRVATKYMNLTRRFFAQRGVAGYRIVPSLGATEGAPAADLAEVIVDITTTGATLRANGLKVLSDGVILKSQANLIASKLAPWSDGARLAKAAMLARLSCWD